ncbi:uncharacterized protein LOC109504199 [Harpegnathos saltator]|uniref:uncharacterized protein LOC109504199 n=1 Tax=Harpegnathos saltator TaxID=610380 RepID=UPI000DBEE6E1|nr:uncharacterized protein LOC109504199 [Harpegnathos saltator]
MATALVRCPQAAASKVAIMERVQVGWIRAGVVVLPARAASCFRCREWAMVTEGYNLCWTAVKGGRTGGPPLSWALRQLDSYMFRAAILAADWHLDEMSGAPLQADTREDPSVGAPANGVARSPGPGRAPQHPLLEGGGGPPEKNPPRRWGWTEDPGCQSGGARQCQEEAGGRGKAPCPDSIPGCAWALALGDRNMSEATRGVMNGCLRDGVFPPEWRRAKLVLPKVSKTPNGPPAYRLICLLDEAGKMLERIIAERFVQHLSSNGPDFHDRQYEFRPGRSTLHVIQHVRDLTHAVMEERGGVFLAISLDNRRLQHPAVAGDCAGAAAQPSACLSPAHPRGLFWGQGPRLFGSGRSPGPAVDGPRGSREGELREARFKAEVALATVVGTISELGLKVAPNKTEAVFFHDGSRRAPTQTRVLVDGVRARVGPTIKYLGLTLDGRWDFRAHFSDLAPRVRKAGWNARHLYVGVVLSIALYRAPIWAPQLLGIAQGKSLMHQALRAVAVRAIREYRSIAYMKATTLVGSPLVELLAEERSVLYWRTKLCERGEATARELTALKSQVVARTLQRWEDAMSSPREFGRLTTMAVRPCLAEFTGRRRRGLNYHLVQVMTGHGCFGHYLHRIKKEPTTGYHHCPEPDDAEHHTLSECPA